MTYHYIYRIENLITGNYYIGAHSTRNLFDNYMGSGILIKKAVKYYGEYNFEMVMLYNFKTRKEMFIAERKIINKDIVNDPNSYNLITGGAKRSKNTYKISAKTKNCTELLKH